VVGGGVAGCEEASQLSAEGRDVTILEMLDGLAKDAPFQYRLCMLDMMEKIGVKSYLNAKVTKIAAEGVEFVDALGESRFLEADCVILAVGLRPRNDEAEKFRPVAPVFRIAGDCASSRRIGDAVREGHFAGYYIQ
jgi:pyruvate/2-oxoglutarate dehydrogenase complex dihydrolipoamide dehydrogenase (E3) component